MAKKFDGVIVGVHFAPDGQVDWVRAYERRGPTFSDRIMIKRQDLIEQIKAGKKFIVGKRIPYEASNFKLLDDIQVIQQNGRDVLVTSSESAGSDSLVGVPEI